MRFKPEIPGAALSQEALAEDYSKARNLGKIRLGEACIYLQKFSGTAYLPCGFICRAWLRQEEVRARMCCATANFDQFFLVMLCDGGQELRWHVEDKAEGQKCLDHIAARNPEVNIGFVKPQS